MIVVTGSVTAKEANFEALRAAALEHVHRSRLEPGCIYHSVHVDCENPLRLFFFERWTDKAALHAHFKVPESGAFVAMLREHGVAATGPDMYEVADPPQKTT